jgi:integrase/recombinase XerD
MSVLENAIKEIMSLLVEDFNRNDEGVKSVLLKIENTLYFILSSYHIEPKEPRENTQLTTDINPDAKAYQMFFVAKKIEGLSEKSLKYYALIIRRFLAILNKPLATIITDDIRYYFALRKNVSLVTLTNERRVLLSFFSWLTNEEYVTKNPVLKIKNIKQPKVIKKPFSQTELEELRDACITLRDKAILETLLSTGMRCSELSNVNIKDVDFSSGEILVTGKGNKQRICYLNAAAKKRLKDYLEIRNDVYEPLFISIEKRSKAGRRLLPGGIQTLVKAMGKRANITQVHPHRFRRTSATMALQRGMPVEQVRIMLGHEKIDTTMRYAITADNSVKHSHEKFM